MGRLTVQETHEIAIGKSYTNPIVDSCKIIIVDTIAVHIFFDGTGNNMFNSEAKRDPVRSRVKYIQGNSSHENYYSNVALLYQAMQNKKNVYKMYIEGIGTRYGQKDDTVGGGFALGENGIFQRYEQTLKKIDLLFKELELSSQVQHFIKKDFVRRFPV